MTKPRYPILPESEVTPERWYLGRRQLLALGAGSLVGAVALRSALSRAATPGGTPLAVTKKQELAGGETPSTLEQITHYNNFYEFGTDKDDPSKNAGSLKTRPWTVSIEGEVAKPKKFEIDELIKAFPLEERIYRMRCVEAWSMVIPWVGFPLAELVKRVEPTSKAKYVAFESLADPAQMPEIKRRVIEYPYVEGLRLDEAMHPLALLAVGLYGQSLPNQDGAPIRLVVPWKYGFKGAKSLVKIRFTAEQPPTTWNLMAPREYGFYANVNPDVDHPRWSQAKERRIGEFSRRKTLPFNGYAEQVAPLYKGLDLAKNF